jgi:hypothetical protein
MERYKDASELDQMFDDGEDITPYLDLAHVRRPGREVRRVNVDFPIAIVAALDVESARLGVTRQSLIKMWIADRLGQCAPQAPADTAK